MVTILNLSEQPSAACEMRPPFGSNLRKDQGPNPVQETSEKKAHNKLTVMEWTLISFILGLCLFHTMCPISSSSKVQYLIKLG